MEQAVAYLLSKSGCMHPFRISRILVLAYWRGAEELGREMTVRGESFGFYVEEIPRVVENMIARGCAEKNEEGRCVRYKCEEPQLPEGVKEVLDSVYEETKNVSDIELNRLVVRDPRYKKLVGVG